MLTTRDLVASLGLPLLVDGPRADEPVRWIHPTELLDPLPFLEAHELLLTTGLALVPPFDDFAGYARRLADGGVAALGFGIAPVWDEVPAELVSACRALGLPLFRIPADTPLIAVTKAVAEAWAHEVYDAVVRLEQHQSAMVRAVGRPGAVDAVLRRLAEALDGWAALLDPTGRLTAASSPSVLDQAARRGLAAQVRRRRFGTFGFAADGEEVLGQSLGTPGTPMGTLLTGRTTPYTVHDSALVSTAASVLTMVNQGTGEAREADAHLRSLALAAVLHAGPAARTALGPHTVRRDRHDQWRVLLLAARGTDARIEDLAARAPGIVLHAPAGGALAAVVPDEDAEGTVRWLTERQAAVGASGPGRIGELDRQLQEAAAALTAATQRQGTAGVWFPELARGPLRDVIGEEAAHGFAAERLAPLDRLPIGTSETLVSTLTAWLKCHGVVDRAAAALGVHRHTVTARLLRIASVLDVDLDDLDTRTELWLALSWREPRTEPG
ncbi:PucR family transcriptional regulator ligand-binding domain-containing protein [Peterkaempfera sp. SMS 1(5)a]|uniref:PucR family transcriptional regulator n=1 Tax=Peterkaempfera podocarpi TaxID=3232308 RepID=UPI003672C288